MNVEHTEYFCPNCGKQDVYVDSDDSGDYYAGTPHYCMACHSRLPDLDQGNGDVLWKHEEYGAEPYSIACYLDVRRAAALPSSSNDETVRIERELAEAQRMQDARNPRRE